MGIRCADHVSPSIRKFGTNFADKRRSLGRRVHSRTKATEFSFSLFFSILMKLEEISPYEYGIGRYS
jgi:hypothetical protein